MKADEATRSSTNGVAVGQRQSHEGTFAKVLDGRKQPIRSLWVRNGRFYAQLKIENPVSGVKKIRRVPLNNAEGNPVQTVAQAVAELKRLQTQRSDNKLPVLGRTPKFADFVKRYLEFVSSGQGTKKASSIEKETAILARWADAIGQLRLDQIKRVHVNHFIEKRLKQDVSPRTINLDVIAFRVVMKQAVEDGLVQRLPTEGLRPLKTTTPKRQLFTTEDLEKICAAAHEQRSGENGANVPVTENAQQFSDYIRFLAYCGARRTTSTLRRRRRAVSRSLNRPSNLISRAVQRRGGVGSRMRWRSRSATTSVMVRRKRRARTESGVLPSCLISRNVHGAPRLIRM